MGDTGKLTLPEIAKLAKVEYRTLHSWVERGLIKPSVYQGTGTGRPNLYSERDAKVTVTLARLRRNGLSMDALSLVATQLNDGDLADCPACASSFHLSEVSDAA